MQVEEDVVMNTNKYKPVNEWEEAGGEFYQEILPSKQSRCATTKRRQSGVQDFKIKYWQQSTQKQSTHKPSDVQFAKLPDLSEVNTNEELIWEEILQIKFMPINMEQKKSLKTSLNSATKLRMIGFKQFKWNQRKLHQRLRLKWSEWKGNLELWRHSLKQIEGYFGAGVVAYFQFLRALFILNAVTFLVMLLFIIIPQIVNFRNEHDRQASAAMSLAATAADERYDGDSDGGDDSAFTFAQFVDPSKSPLLYGSYLHTIIDFYQTNDRDDGDMAKVHLANQTEATAPAAFAYNLTVAYVSVNCACVCAVSALLVYAMSCEFKKRLKNGTWQLCEYCNLIFGGWDYCTHSMKFTATKHKAAYIALKQLLRHRRRQRGGGEQRVKKSRNYMLKRHITRVIIHLTTVLMLVVLCCCTYMLLNMQSSASRSQHKFSNAATANGNTSTSTTITIASTNSNSNSNITATAAETNTNRKMMVTAGNSTTMTLTLSAGNAADEFIQFLSAAGNDVKLFLIELTPYLLIVLLNTLLSVLFNYLRTLEHYSPAVALHLAIVRNALLRLTTLLTVLYYMVHNVIPQLQEQSHGCWENYVSQQMYNFILAEFCMQTLLTFAINLPLALCARRVKHAFVRALQMFEVPKHALDVIYMQAICWLGLFYSPGFPLLAAIMLFVTFYVKKFQCLVNSSLSVTFYPRSRAIATFTTALFLTYAIILMAIVYAITSIRPSVSCGLYRECQTLWDAIAALHSHLPNFVQSTFVFVTTKQFIVLCFLSLILLLYYYHTVAAANRNLVEVLRNQLVLEGHDKQFLLNRLSVFIKQYQDKGDV